MSLVAYGSSDESSDDEVITDVKPNEIQNKETNTQINENTKSLKNANLNADLESPKNNEISEILEDKKFLVEGNGLSFGTLPKPKHLQNEYRFATEEDDVPLSKPKTPAVEVPPKRDKAPARISIPSLSEFKDVDEELERSKIKLTASKKGTGLFSVLPPPKNSVVTQKSTLIPNVLKKTTRPIPTATKVSTANPDKCTGRKPEEGKARNTLLTMDYDSNSDDDDKEHVDFFALSKPLILPKVTIAPSSNFFAVTRSEQDSGELKMTDDESLNIVDHPKINETIITEDDKKQNSTLVSTVMNLPRDEILMKNKAEVGPKLPIPEQEFNVDSEGNVAFDEKAIEYLCGKRGVKRKNKMIEEANIIEINGEDIKPDEREWLIKAMTEEPVQRPVSMQGAGPSSQSKKKHQITYLAHQAKAMEVELKNSWSQNRMTRQQTQAKYGF